MFCYFALAYGGRVEPSGRDAFSSLGSTHVDNITAATGSGDG